MSKLPIFEHFLGVGKSQAKIRVVFQAKFFLLNWVPGEREEDRDVLEVGVLALEEPHPREQGVFGGGAGRAAAQNRPVLLRSMEFKACLDGILGRRPTSP